MTTTLGNIFRKSSGEFETNIASCKLGILFMSCTTIPSLGSSNSHLPLPISTAPLSSDPHQHAHIYPLIHSQRPYPDSSSQENEAKGIMNQMPGLNSSIWRCTVCMNRDRRSAIAAVPVVKYEVSGQAFVATCTVLRSRVARSYQAPVPLQLPPNALPFLPRLHSQA